MCVAETVNPKSVTGDELYGYMTLSKGVGDGFAISDYDVFKV